MTAAATDAGAELFARYAYAPNHLGYCGPPAGDVLRTGTAAQVRAAARRFSGAWPYLQVLSAMSGIDDPLDPRVVASYWLGGGVGERLDPREFGARLLAVIGPQAGHYWAHLTADLLDEAAGNHAFHVFGVYPWTRLLGRGADRQPLHVLDSCRITWGTVLARHGDDVDVRYRPLRLAGGALRLAAPVVARIPVLVQGHDPAPGLTADDAVALHWGRICGRLERGRLHELRSSTLRQLDRTNRRLLRRTPDGRGRSAP